MKFSSINHITQELSFVNTWFSDMKKPTGGSNPLPTPRNKKPPREKEVRKPEGAV
jgi:hypothetical protein